MGKPKKPKQVGRRAPLIKRVLIMPPLRAADGLVKPDYNLGEIHYVEDNTTAIHKLMSFSYDIIVFDKALHETRAVNMILEHYIYDSVIVFCGDKNRDHIIAQEQKALEAGGFKVILLESLEPLKCEKDKLVWERHGKDIDHQ